MTTRIIIKRVRNLTEFLLSMKAGETVERPGNALAQQVGRG